MITFPPRNETWDFANQLEAWYRDRLLRPPADARHVDWEGGIVWTQEYLRLRVNGASHQSACESVWRAIQAVVDPQPQTPTTGLQGALRITPEGFYADDTGFVNPVFCHLGDGFARWCRGEQDAVTALARAIRAAGYNGVRAWSVLDSGSHPFWNGYTCGPHVTPNYWDQVAAFAVMLQQTGLRWVVSQGDLLRVWTTPRQLVEFATRLVSSVPREVVAEADVCNEFPNNNGVNGDTSVMVPFARAIASAWPDVPLVLSSSQSEEVDEINALSVRPCNIFSTHSYRGGRYWDKLRHQFSTRYEGAVARSCGHNSEPFGQGTQVSATDNMHELDTDVLVLGAYQSYGSGQVWSFFSGAGVKSDREDLLTSVGFLETPAAVAKLPKDILTWPTFAHGGRTQKGRRIYAVPDGAGETDGTRADHVISVDGRFFVRLYGPSFAHCWAERAHRIEWKEDRGERGCVILGRLS